MTVTLHELSVLVLCSGVALRNHRTFTMEVDYLPESSKIPLYIGLEEDANPTTEESQPTSPISPRGRTKLPLSRLGKESARRRTVGQKRKLSPQAKPLLPAAERKTQEKEVNDVKWDITPDGGSAGREGRQFTVANVGNNGKIYLR